MAHSWTEQQVAALTTDPGVIRDGQKLANASKWLTLGADERAAWGEHKGSAARPYQTQIELTEPAFKCTCPSRKFPCKHALGLFLVLVREPGAFKQAAAPDWVESWLAAREKRATKKKADSLDTEAQARRASAREAKVTAGMQELERWLCDLVRGGLAAEQVRTYEYWDRIAARMVDAQASGVARMLRNMAGLPFKGGDWSERLLDYVGRLYLLVESYQRIETLPPAVQADVRTAIGWTQKQEDIVQQSGLRDDWRVMYSDIETEDRLHTRRTALAGRESGHTALMLDFAHGSPSFEGHFAPGAQFDAELVFYPSAFPLRAAVKQRYSLPAEPPPGTTYRYWTIDAMLGRYAQALSLNPWLDRLPMPLINVIPYHEDDSWYLRDSQHVLPIAPAFVLRGNCWWLLAISGGHPTTVFGDWNGYDFMPLAGLATDGVRS